MGSIMTEVAVLEIHMDRKAVAIIKPRMILPSELDYSQNPAITFEAGNEFRYLDMKAVKYTTDRMQALDFKDDGYHVYIYPDVPRPEESYITSDDINGKYLVAANQSDDPLTEAEYAWVYFLVPYPEPLENGNLYIMGEITYWQFSDENRMKYNYSLNGYEKVLYLKQGYFNYLYGFLPDGSQQAGFSLIEGSHWQTENEYSIFVYHRQRGEFYDRLIAVQYLNSAGE